MKKLLIILLLLLTGIANSQTGYYKRIKVIDSIYIPSGIINASGYYLNGVLQTFGGSPFDLTAFHAFTGINSFSNGTYFDDSAKFTRIVIMDSLIVNNRISGYGSLIDSLSASFIRTGTIDTARLPNDVAFTNQPSNFSVIPTIASFFQNVARTIQYFLPNSASDTLATLNQTQTVTNKTISATSNTISNQTTGYIQFSTSFGTIADGSTFYVGNVILFAANNANYSKIYLFANCTIDAIVLTISVNTTLATSENAVFTVLKNGTTTIDTITTAGKFDASSSNYTRTGLSLSLSAGDYLQVKWVNPTYATNPLNVGIGGYFHLK